MPLIRGSDKTDTHRHRVTSGTRADRGVRAGRAHCEVSLGQRTSCRGSSATGSHELQGDFLTRATGALQATPLNHTAGQACSLSPPAAKGQGARDKGQGASPAPENRPRLSSRALLLECGRGLEDLLLHLKGLR